MSGTVTTSELIDRLVQQSGMKKKRAAEILRAIPEVIEEGLMRDGEVRVKGLGTFRMKWTQSRPGRNPKTGENVPIPPHYRITFLPEQSLRDFIDRDNRLLSYTVVPDGSQKTEDRRQKTEDRRQKIEEDVFKAGKLTELHEEAASEVIDNEYEPEVPVRKRRVHWIIPTAIVVIAALSVVFYFRNFYPAEKKTEVRSQKTEVRSQKTEVRSQKTEVRSQKTEVRSQLVVDSVAGYGLGDTGTTSEVIKEPTSKSQEPIASSEQPQATTQNSQLQLKTQDSRLKTIAVGKHLFQLAREEYGNPFLWVLIYKANQDVIKDPDQAIIGKTVNIPALEGTPGHLSHNDSLEVAEGYRLVYEFYKGKGDAKAEEFYKAYQKYLFH